MNETLRDDKTWRALLAPYKQAAWGPALIQLANTVVPFALLWGLMSWAATRGAWWAVLPLAVPASFFFIRLFIFQHDCGHGSFFPSRRANNLLGGMLGVITLFPYGYWKKTHAVHHATSGNLDDREFGDIVTMTVAEYGVLSPWRRLLYRLYRHPLVMFAIGPSYQFVLKHRFPFDLPFAWKREWLSVLKTNLALAAVYTVAVLALGWQTVLMVQAPIIVVAGALGVWLFYVQHQFEDTYWARQGEWTFHAGAMRGSTHYDLPAPLRWLTANIGIHHVHHLASRIPSYRLPKVLADHPELREVGRLTLRQSPTCFRIALWDEESRRLVAFRDLRTAPARDLGRFGPGDWSQRAAAHRALVRHPTEGLDQRFRVASRTVAEASSDAALRNVMAI